MNAIEQPILTVTGIRKSEGNMVAEGRSVDWSNTVVTVLQPFTEDEVKSGAIGMKATEYKIKGGQFFHDYQHQQLPGDAHEEDFYYHECFVFRKFNKIKGLKYTISYNV